MPTDDRRAALFQAYRDAADLVEGTDAAMLDRPTPCPEYDVAAMVDHLVGAARRAAALGRGEQPATEEQPHVELADAPAALRRAGEEAEAAWADDASLTSTVTMPWGETYAGSTLVDMYVAELAAHTWDLAAATGRLGTLPAGPASTALAAARAMMQPGYRDAAGPGSPFGPEVDAPVDATPWERFAAFMGRQPRPSGG